MQHERNAFKAGLFIIISIGLMIGIIIGIKGIGRFLEPMQHRTITFKLTDDLGGLSPGDEVRVGGAKVGVVRGIEIAPDGAAPGAAAIRVHVSIPRRFQLYDNAVVSVQSTLTGVSVLNFSSLGSGTPLASGAPLAGRPSPLSALLDSAGDIQAIVRDVRMVTMPKVNNAIDKTNDAVAAFHTTGQTATDAIAHLRSRIDPIVERYNAAADMARDALTQIRDLFGDTKADFRTTVANVRDITTEGREKVPGILDQVDALLSESTSTVERAKEAMVDLKKIAENTREASGTVRQLLAGNRSRFDAIVAALRATMDNMKQGSAELRHNPWRLLHKPEPGEMANLDLFESTRDFADGAGRLNDAASALRDALESNETDEARIQQLLDRLDETFTHFNTVEQKLWQQVKE